MTRFPRRGMQTLAPPSLIVARPARPGPRRARQRAPAAAAARAAAHRARPVAGHRPGGRRFELPDGQSHAEAFAAVDVDGLRPYRPGTPASRIHWPAVARGAGLIERRLRADGDTRPLIVLDARGGGPPELLDAAVRAAASLTLELARSGGCGLLLAGEQRVTTIDRELITWPAAYARLAMIEGGPRRAAPALTSAAGRLGAMIYVAVRPPERLAALLPSGRARSCWWSRSRRSPTAVRAGSGGRCSRRSTCRAAAASCSGPARGDRVKARETSAGVSAERAAVGRRGRLEQATPGRATSSSRPGAASSGWSRSRRWRCTEPSAGRR